MCGICGEYNLTGDPVNPEYMMRMVMSLKHRGPDDQGIYCSGPIGMGHRRLSIIDLSPNGRQPMWSNDGTLCIVYNGEVYNYLEIKQDLLAEGYSFFSTTDTEVIVNAIHCWGIEKALLKFIGMFAFAVWDARERVFILCRDRVGIKPLYYYSNDKLFLFGSEVKSIITHPSFIGEINFAALREYFVIGYFLDNQTVFRNLYKLSPGHFLMVNKNGNMKLHKYWGIDTIKRDSFDGIFEDAAEKLEELLENAFTYRLVSDVPVGLFLSGGIDSSLVSAILKKKANVDILNITVGFREKIFDESPKAKRVSEELGVKNIVHYISSEEAQDSLFKFCEIYDEPFGDTSGIPTYILSRLAREHVKVALSADGGDEQFCGYEDYASYCRNYDIVTRFPFTIRMVLSKFLQHCIPYKLLLSIKAGLFDRESFFPQSIARYEKMLRLLNVSDKVDLIRLMNEKAWSYESVKDFLGFNGGALFQDTVLSRKHLDDHEDELIDKMMRTDYTAFLRDDILVRVDRASMFVSLECRDPFLDHRIAEFAFSLPVSYVYENGEHKRILKKILRKWISEDVISSPKRGFMIPLYQWLRGAWKPVVMEYLSGEKIKAIGVLDEKKVTEELNKFYRYHGCRAEKIWMMLNFQMWAERWLLS